MQVNVPGRCKLKTLASKFHRNDAKTPRTAKRAVCGERSEAHAFNPHVYHSNTSLGRHSLPNYNSIVCVNSMVSEGGNTSTHQHFQSNTPIFSVCPAES